MVKKYTNKKNEEVHFKSVSAKTPNQKEYIKLIQNNDFVVCNGLCGTGKTHVAIGMGFDHLYKGIVETIIIARPVVESGESLGFLPGDIEDKMSPYVRPIFDELKEYASYSSIAQMRNNGQLEICPIAFMRGRTFKNSFIIVDECQNANETQIEMIFTRLGENSKMVLTGDITQSDLNRSHQGAFQRLYDRFDTPFMRSNGIACIKLGREDIVRNPKIEIMLQAWNGS